MTKATDAKVYIDVTPSFEAVADILLVLLSDGNAEGKATAEAEIRRWGKLLDKAKVMLERCDSAISAKQKDDK